MSRQRRASDGDDGRAVGRPRADVVRGDRTGRDGRSTWCTAAPCRRIDVRRRAARPVAAVAAPVGDGRGGRALRLPRRPVGPLQRTSAFLAVTTFGTAADAQRAVDKVRGIHRRVHGVAPDGRPYRADDPHLLEWVHIAEVDSFLLAHRLYGGQTARPGRSRRLRGRYRAGRRRTGRAGPAAHRGRTRQRIEDFRLSCAAAEAARDAARFLLVTPAAAAAGAGALRRGRRDIGCDAAVAGRLPLRLPYLPPVETTAIRVAGRALVGGIRWAMSANQPEVAAVDAEFRATPRRLRADPG